MREVIVHPESDCIFAGKFTESDAQQGAHTTRAHELRAGELIATGLGWSRVLPDMDFETYSEAGFYFDEELGKWSAVPGSPKTGHGLPAVGTPVYTEHDSAEILSLAYDLKDGLGPRLWLPGMPPPVELFNHIANPNALPLEAHNSGFEWYVWNNIGVRRHGWPALPLERLSCSMAKGKAFGLPGALGKVAEVLEVGEQKDKAGANLMKLTKPRQPTKNIHDRRFTPLRHSDEFSALYNYNIQDIRAESAVSAQVPDLSAYERGVWIFDQRVNTRGAPIDTAGLNVCRDILNKATAKYTEELNEVTRGAVPSAAAVQKFGEWLAFRGVPLPNMQKETIAAAVKRDDLPPDVKRALEIRVSLGSNSVKKINAILLRISRDGRLRELFRYYGAERTGRFAGAGAQPQNLPSAGPSVKQCDPVNGCGKHSHIASDACPWCGSPGWVSGAAPWSPEAVDDALEAMATGDLAFVERAFGDAIALIGGCLRGLFCAPPGRDLIASDFTAIEGVVAAAIAGEEWRLEVFRTHGLIYESSASAITGIPLDEFIRHKKETGEHHPLRKKIGKIAELASGFQGGVNAWKAFGAADLFESDDEIKAAVDAWRAASPNIVNCWYGLERAAKNAVRSPGTWYEYNGIKYGVKDGVLYCELLSGRRLAYQNPRLVPDVLPWGKPTERLEFDGWNSDSTKGRVGWKVIDTFGGRLFENVVQATARDIMVHAMLNLEAAGYPVVLHVHDEPVAEVAEGAGDVAHFEALMVDLPEWCKNWPIKAAGGWRGKRYRKD